MHIIGGMFQGHQLKTPNQDKTRPTQSALREALFNICQFVIEGADFLDIFAGSGAMGFEALSRGACKATFIEQDFAAANIIKENASKLNVEDKITLIKRDVRKALPSLKKPYDLIYADPPYEWMDSLKTLETLCDLIDAQKLMKPTSRLFIEVPFNKKHSEFHSDRLSIKKIRKYGKSHLLEFEINS